MAMCLKRKENKSLKLSLIVLAELVSPQIFGNQIVKSKIIFALLLIILMLNGNCIRGPLGSINLINHLIWFLLLMKCTCALVIES